MGYVKSGATCIRTQCSNGSDDIDPEDTLIDYPSDPGCTDVLDNNEEDSAIPATAPTINATPRVVSAGSNTSLSWNLGGSLPASCTLTKNGQPSGLDLSLGVASLPVNVRTTYVLTCGAQNDWVTVEVEGYGTET